MQNPVRHLGESARRVILSRTWNAFTIIDVKFVTDMRTVAWPAKEPKGVAVFDGPLCLRLSSEAADVDLPWVVQVDASGQLILDSEGRPRVTEPSGRTVKTLEPIAAD